MYTRYTCIYTICTSNAPLSTLQTPYIRPKYTLSLCMVYRYNSADLAVRWRSKPTCCNHGQVNNLFTVEECGARCIGDIRCCKGKHQSERSQRLPDGGEVGVASYFTLLYPFIHLYSRTYTYTHPLYMYIHHMHT